MELYFRMDLELQCSRLDHFIVLFRVCIMYIILRIQDCIILFWLSDLSPDDIVLTW
ncbi:hypothetical protein M6B38_369315 [Iris pallida]|uniref:Uncharacterized protein n=1 Tax=Iris pallida TaxID=29817 RepID=A0AAX6GEP4_IRIPA|nr:hypothetical protein M6B38_369315 [Iris pallida]